MSRAAATKPIVLITGGSRGIGRATCVLAAARGFHVVVNYANSGDLAASVVNDIRSSGGEADAVQADVSSETAVRLMFASIARKIGPLTHLVNNAGVVEEKASGVDISTDRFDRMLSVNLRGVFLCMREATTRMGQSLSQQDRAIVNISSYSVRTGGAFYHLDYAAAKAGVEALTVGFARELAPSGIRVNAVAPGATDTDMAAGFTGDDRHRIEARIGLGRFARPDEIAESIVWLLSPRASYVTGTILTVAGGK